MRSDITIQGSSEGPGPQPLRTSTGVAEEMRHYGSACGPDTPHGLRRPSDALQSPVDDSRKPLYTHRSAAGSSRGFSVLLCPRTTTMKVRSSLKSLKTRHRDCKVVRRKGVVYVINKTDPRFKAKQG